MPMPQNGYAEELEQLQRQRDEAIAEARAACSRAIAQAHHTYRLSEAEARERSYDRSDKRVNRARAALSNAAVQVAEQFEQGAMFSRDLDARQQFYALANWVRETQPVAMRTHAPEVLVRLVREYAGQPRVALLRALGMQVPDPPANLMPGVDASSQAPGVPRAAGDASPALPARLEALLGATH